MTSSAYIVVLLVALDDWILWGRLFINIVHRTGPNRVPCGTPPLKTCGSDLWPVLRNMAQAVRSDKKLLIRHLRAGFIDRC